jgi:hypothetical protein
LRLYALVWICKFNGAFSNYDEYCLRFQQKLSTFYFSRSQAVSTRLKMTVFDFIVLLLFISCRSCLLNAFISSLAQLSIVNMTDGALNCVSSAISEIEKYGLSDQRFCIRMKICVTEERPAVPAT